MKWIFSVYDGDHRRHPLHRGRGRKRRAVVGTACVATVEAAIRDLDEELRDLIRAIYLVRDFIDDKLDPSRNGYYFCSQHDERAFTIAIGPVHEVLP